MFEIEKNDRVNELIDITKSNSGISGPILAKAHMELGELLAEKLLDLDPEDTTIVAILRGGLFFAEGMYFKLGCKFQIYDPKRDTFVRPITKNVILVDSVINTGKTILEILEVDMMVACCVINKKAVANFNEQLYTIRVSENSFVGTSMLQQVGNKGPDTTMRLFNLLSY
ncbi:MAG: phosphoribosyltransferase [Catonella sp.]|uniref:phosphoribosyltransferase n=1 Tax=Catonella sp. TaxID=2382125 RepID=UPI003FA0700B